jgi:hypothetical protein
MASLLPKDVIVGDESMTSGRGQWPPKVVPPHNWLRYED